MVLVLVPVQDQKTKDMNSAFPRLDGVDLPRFMTILDHGQKDVDTRRKVGYGIHDRPMRTMENS